MHVLDVTHEGGEVDGALEELETDTTNTQIVLV